MGRTLAFLYGVISYLIFLLTFLYAIGFVGNFFVPKSIDAGPQASTLTRAIIANVILLSIFGLQHSIMARPEFKERWTKIVPKSVERSTFVLLASLALILLFWQWRVMPWAVWHVDNEIGRFFMWAMFFAGWAIVLLGTFLINHFDLFGLRQVYLHQRGIEYTPLDFGTPILYRIVRHPIMLGFIIAFWFTPDMSWGHLLFAAVTTVYVFVAIQFEERDLKNIHGESYEQYRREVSMLLPIPRKAPETRTKEAI